MATIAIRHSVGGLGWDKTAPGNGIKQAFSNAVKNSSTLKNSLKSLKTQIGNIESVADVDASAKKAAAAEERETTKQSALSFAYNKIEEYMQKVESVDLSAAKEIQRLKGDFYSNYSYLKPDSEKTTMERFGDGWNNFWGGFKDFIVGIGTAIKDFFVGVYEWCKEHIVAVVALVVVAVAVIAACFLGPAAVIAVCSAIAFLCSVADLTAVAITGKDVSTLLRESGHPILADIFSGIEIGSIATASILSVASLAGQISKVGLKFFLTGGEKGIGNILKYHLKNVWGGIKADWKALTGEHKLKAFWNIVVLNQSGDFDMKDSISAYRNGKKVIAIGDNNPNITKNPDGTYSPKGEFKETLAKYGKDTDYIHLKEYGNTIDYDWNYYAVSADNPMGDYAAKADFSKIYSENRDAINIKYETKGNLDRDMRPLLWNNAQVEGQINPGVDEIKGLTRHELFNVKSGNVQIYQIPTEIHKGMAHYGGTSVVKDIWINTMNNSLFREETQRFTRGSFEFVLDKGGESFFSWAHSGGE